MRRTLAAIILLCLGTVANARAQAPASKSADASPARSADLQVVLLGTGFPRPYPDRAGPSTLVIANGKYFVVDAGRGVMMRLASLGQPVRRAPNLVMPGMPRVEAVLLTHLIPTTPADYPTSSSVRSANPRRLNCSVRKGCRTWSRACLGSMPSRFGSRTSCSTPPTLAIPSTRTR